MSGGDHSEDAMRLAFEQYMMANTNANANANANSNDHTRTDDKQAVQDEEQEKEQQRKLQFHQRQQQQQQQMKKAEKKYWQLSDKVHRIIREEWLDLDDQAYQVVQALEGIRTRLPMHARLLKLFQQDRHEHGVGVDTTSNDNDADVDGKCWKNHGFHHNIRNKNTKANACLSGEDVQNALSHDMIQHEKMLAALRGLFANLSECHEMILRSLDEITKYHLDFLEEFRNNNVELKLELELELEVKVEFEPSFLKASGSVGIMRDVIAMLSNELYRKQCMVHMILDSVEDELMEDVGSGSYSDGAKGEVGAGVGVGGEWEDLSPKDVVQRCCMMWPRESKDSCIEIAALSPALTNK